MLTLPDCSINCLDAAQGVLWSEVRHVRTARRAVLGCCCVDRCAAVDRHLGRTQQGRTRSAGGRWSHGGSGRAWQARCPSCTVWQRCGSDHTFLMRPNAPKWLRSASTWELGGGVQQQRQRRPWRGLQVTGPPSCFQNRLGSMERTPLAPLPQKAVQRSTAAASLESRTCRC